MPYSSKPYTFDRVVRLVIAIVVIFGLLWLVNRLRGVLLPFLVACLIAYLLEPFVQYNRRLLRLKGRVAAIFVTLFETLFLVGLACYFFIPMLIDEISTMGEILRQYSSSSSSIPYLPDSIHDFIKRNIDLAAISDFLT